MGDIKVLVVDDQRLIREGISSLLNIQHGLKVVGTAGNGRDALEAVERTDPDVILMDIRMPVMDGITAAREIIQRGCNCQVIMLTTFDDDEYIVRSLQAGAVGYLLKDIPPDDLAGAVRMAHQGIYQMSPGVTGRLVGRLKPGAPEEGPIRKQADELLAGLSERERDVLKQISKGLTNREIADVLCISEGTVKNHVSNILTALNLRDRTQAALFVIKNGLFS
ncbi:MAG: response regulator transcription factor [Spirochaetales bacterium]|nr:response regulator transcription factor [Spirochaetales bacterium]